MHRSEQHDAVSALKFPLELDVLKQLGKNFTHYSKLKSIEHKQNQNPHTNHLVMFIHVEWDARANTLVLNITTKWRHEISRKLEHKSNSAK